MASSLFKAVEPREDVLEGTLSEAIFAASLDEVVAGSAPAVYGDPETFFAGTHPSAGLKTLLDEALGRVGGGKPDAPSVIRLETNLGGGKTHNLLDGRVAIVTGAQRGIGYACAEALLAAGAGVACIDLPGPTLDEDDWRRDPDESLDRIRHLLRVVVRRQQALSLGSGRAGSFGSPFSAVRASQRAMRWDRTMPPA